MSRLRTIRYAVLTAGLFSAGGAYAQSMYGVDRQQDYQQDRIEHGIRDGQITRSEAYRLEQGERAIDRAQSRAGADGVVTPQERARIDRMVDQQGRDIHRQSHDGQQAWDRGQSWGHTDGRRDGWRDNGGRHDSWARDGWGGNNRGWDRDHGGDRGQHTGWERGNHYGWDGNRPPGVERRDARNEQRMYNGAHDGSLTRGEYGQLQRGQERVDHYQARARSDGNVTPYERNRMNNMQNRESQRIYADRHNGRTAATPTAGPNPGQQTANSRAGWSGWANGGTRGQAQAQAQPRPQAQPQQAPTMRPASYHPRTQGQTMPSTATAPRPTMQYGSTGGQSWGGGHRSR